MSITQAGYVTSIIEDKIAYITFFHPAHNSLPSNLLQQLVAAINAAGEGPSVLAVVLKSEGDKTFCAGASFDELSAIEDFETGHQFFSGFANVINAMRKCAGSCNRWRRRYMLGGRLLHGYTICFYKTE
jgi:methylglutaconyl-CoA hydratase